MQKLVFGVMVCGLACGLATARASELLDPEERIAVMSAYEPEWMALQADLENGEEHVINGSRFLSGEIEDTPVVLILSGIGMVNAAMTTQQAIDHFSIEAIVFSGIAGGVDPALNIGDVVIADRWGQYLHSVFAREIEGTFVPPPFIDTVFSNFGMIHPQTVRVTRDGTDEPEAKFWFDVDPDLMEAAVDAASGLELLACAADACLSDPPRIVIGGNGVSGSVFVDNADFRRFVFDTFEARVLDMETAATAHVAHNNSIPFIAFRSLSDLAGGGEGENEIGTFFGLASENSAKVVKAFLRAL